jgi:hypothetical protein
MARKPVRDRIRQRPVRVAGVVLAVLMWVLSVVPGEEPDVVVQAVIFLAPIIAAFITERFTFSQSFLKEIMRLIPNDGNASLFAQRHDARLTTDTDDPFPRERGISTLGALVILCLVLIFIFILFPNVGRG